jgi:hypothetical protein
VPADQHDQSGNRGACQSRYKSLFLVCLVSLPTYCAVRHATAFYEQTMQSKHDELMASTNYSLARAKIYIRDCLLC